MPSVTTDTGITFSIDTKINWTEFIQTHSIKKELKTLVVKGADNSDSSWQEVADKLTAQVDHELGVDPVISHRYIQEDVANTIVMMATYTRYRQYTTVDGVTTADDVYFTPEQYAEYIAVIKAIMESVTITPIETTSF